MTAPTDALDLAELRRLAEAARAQTSDAWCVVRYGDGNSLVIHYDEDNRVCFMATAGRNHEADMARITANAAYIVATQPATVLSLLARLERAESEREALRAAAASLDTALSNLWREGPVEAGHENHLGPVDAAWTELRAALARVADDVTPAQWVQRAEAERDAARAERDRMREACQQVADWAGAYPEDMFPPVDLASARARLGDDALFSRLHAQWARHLCKGIGAIAGAALGEPRA